VHVTLVEEVAVGALALGVGLEILAHEERRERMPLPVLRAKRLLLIGCPQGLVRCAPRTPPVRVDVPLGAARNRSRKTMTLRRGVLVQRCGD
jgi:hypothetical protein